MLRALVGYPQRHPKRVVLSWIALVVAGFVVGIQVFSSLNTDVGRVPGSASAQASAELRRLDPKPPTLTAVVSGQPVADLRSTLDPVLTELRTTPGVTTVSEPQPSATTDRAVLVTITLESEKPGRIARAVADRLDRLEQGSAVEVAVAGGPLSSSEFGGQAAADVQRAEMVSGPVVAVLLLAVFGGVLAAGLPLLLAAVAIGVAFGILYLFSTVTDVSVYAIQVTTMLGVGLAVDYALLLVSRFREERARGLDVADAVHSTGVSAGRTVLFSGLTVTVSLAGLTVFPDPFLRSMGLAGAAVVAVDMLAALTLAPALLTLVGHRISVPSRPDAGGTRGTVFATVAALATRRPMITVLAGVTVLAVLAIPVAHLRLGESDPRSMPASSRSRTLHDALRAHFPDTLTPASDRILVAAPATDPAVTAFSDRVARLPGVTGVTATAIATDRTRLTVTTEAPAYHASSARRVAAIRALPAPFRFQVTGGAAGLADYRHMLRTRGPVAALVVLLATFVLLFGFTRSIWIPIKALLTNLLGLGAALGVVVWAFQDGHAGVFGATRLDATDLTVPVLVAMIAFGLAVDYEMFLLSRILQERAAGADTRTAVVAGVARSGRIVTSAALLLCVVFGAFLTAGFTPIKAIGLGLAVAVALDATVIRMLVVPATMVLLGRYNWWLPRPLRGLGAHRPAAADRPLCHAQPYRT
ncbi:MAG: MMPL family transporter [Dactylosporangium sp.]|nr:MMPL family transporter [Dactylosporangium sp.]NNJ63279.1 MMPL family transporter [Dactylosporangium sp.]